MKIEVLLDALYGDDADERWLQVVSLRWEGLDLHLELLLHTDDTEVAVESRWLLACQGVLEYSISKLERCGLNHWTDREHPLLKEQLEPEARLFFLGVPRTPAAVIGDLWLAHRAACDDWIDFDACVRRDVRLDELLAGGEGLLADGPQFLIEAYAQVLRGHELRPSVVGLQTPKRWDGSQHVDVSNAEAVHFGSGSVVATSFEVTQCGR